MSERQLTIMERWALGIGAPVIAAAIIAVWAMLWQMYNTQVELAYQISELSANLERTYTETDAERDLAQVDQRLREHNRTLEYQTERLDTHNNRLDDQDERLRELEGRPLLRPHGGGQ